MSKQRTTVDSTPRLDWAEIHRRLDAVAHLLERGIEPSPQEQARVLAARAQALAREPAAAEPTQQLLEVLEFQLAHERYAVEAGLVREVYPLRDITPLPATPAFVAGIINLRGEIVSVIDLRTFFDLPHAGLTDFSKVIIVRDSCMEFGILADAVIGVHRLALATVQPSLPTLTGIRADYLRGVAPGGLTILDAAKILADPALIVREEVRS